METQRTKRYSGKQVRGDVLGQACGGGHGEKQPLRDARWPWSQQELLTVEVGCEDWRSPR